MGLIEALQSIKDGKLPEGCMAITTTNGSSHVNLYGVNKKGFSVPLNKIEDLIKELEKECIDQETLYEVGHKDSYMEVPGYKLEKISKYLREARDIGVQFANYTKMF